MAPDRVSVPPPDWLKPPLPEIAPLQELAAVSTKDTEAPLLTMAAVPVIVVPLR